MISKLKIPTLDRCSSVTSRPVALFLTMMLVVAYPGLSQSANKQLIEYYAGNVQSDFEESQKGEGMTKGYEEQAPSRPEKESIYQKVKAVIEQQKVLESNNQELTDKLALKNEIITSLGYNQQVLWSQLEDSKTIYWDALNARDVEHKKAEELNHQLALKENIIKTLTASEKNLKAQLEDNKKKFERALAAIDPGYQPTEERVSLMSNSLFGYSPPATNKTPLLSNDTDVNDSNPYSRADIIADKTTDNSHPLGSLVCITCHGGDTNFDNVINTPAEVAEPSKSILWDDKFDASDFIILNNLNSNEEIINNHSTSDNIKEDSISTMKTWTSPPSSINTCIDQEADSFCAEDSETDSWWHWFYQKISTLKTSVAETVYSYL